VAQTGMVPMPGSSEKMVGGHAVLIVGSRGDRFIARNSWSTTWGDKGYFYMPVEYFTNPDMSDDLWIIKSVR
jgi:C1A family cysteine protease